MSANIKIYANPIEDTALEQINELANLPAFENSKIRIMSDAHAGKGCVVGFTSDFAGKIIPNIVGVDIGCGVLAAQLPISNPDKNLFENLDRIIRAEVPSGQNVHNRRKASFPNLKNLHCHRSLKDTTRIERSLGTLGGGNHFIEIDTDGEALYLTVHTGSRNLGKQVAELYQDIAINEHKDGGSLRAKEEQLIAEYKAQGRKKEISGALKSLRAEYAAKQPKINPDLCWLEGDLAQDYLHDMGICQEYAMANRRLIVKTICDAINIEPLSVIESVHNYIDLKHSMIRKGAISAQAGEQVIIPLNMAKGCVIGTGLGNPDYNFSAPHGAGRKLSRSKARAELKLKDYEQQMSSIFTTSVNAATLDEAPGAYKDPQAIIDSLKDTVQMNKIIRPLYNFKAN